jgi:membrane glycosyltransferase
MLERTSAEVATAAAPSLAFRRALFAVLVLMTIAGLLALGAVALSPGGIGLVDLVLLVLFALTLPWQVIGLWNAIIGLLIMRFARDPAAVVTPVLARLKGDEPIVTSTAILMCVRNEAPERAIRNLQPLLTSLAASRWAERFHLYVLSDTSDPAVAAREDERFAALTAEWHGRVAVTYRRRERNDGFKAGNIEDFCDRWGADHDFAVTLDADSIMTAEAVLRLVRVMQLDPTIGILQGLVIALPSKSAFARLFQFGMRLGMRSYTIGSAWWQGDCGPYWGHNGILRLAPFMAHCRLPPLSKKGPLGGFILSHDQVEAVLMRRAGYQCRVLAQEDLGWEENPPTLIEFLRRDLRWCQGNLQYLRLLGLPGLTFVSRYQLAFAILMFLGSPGWIGLFALGTLVLAAAPATSDVLRADASLALFGLVLLMWFAPKLASVIDVLVRPAELARFGGLLRFAAGVIVESLFTLLLLPIMWLRHTLFMAGLPFGRAIGWIGQVRDDHYVPLTQAARHLWPHAVLGLGALALLGATHPAATAWSLFLAAGPALAIPFATLTSSQRFGAILVRFGLGRLPEETAPPATLRDLAASGAKAGTTAPAQA